MLLKPSRLLLALSLALLASACEKSPSPSQQPGSIAAPTINHARVLLPGPGASMGAGYFDVSNPGATAIELRGVTSPSFDSVEMHETREEDGMSRMRQIEKVEIPAGGSASFESGGKHLMLMGSRLVAEAPLRELPMRLEFVAPDGSRQVVEAPFAVESAGDEPTPAHH